MPQPVRVAFLGGLGEIGRNCMAIELDGRLLLIDCGLMFPDADMHGIDLVLPDFTYLREQADRIEAVVATHGHEDHVGGAVRTCCASSRSRSTARRSRSAWPATASRRPACSAGPSSSRCADGERRQIGPFDVEFIPVTHSVPHAFAIAVHTPQGVILHSGDFKLDLTPVDGRLTDLARIGAIAASEGIRLLLADSTNAEERGPRAERARRRRRAAAAVRPAGRPADHHRQLRQPHPPHPADRRRRRSPRAARSPPSGCRCARTCAWPATSACCSIPDASLVDIEEVDRPAARRGVRHLHRLAGRADVGAVAAGPGREPLAEADDRRHGDPVEPRHPGQRVQRQPGDRRPAAARRRGRPLRRRRRPRHRPRPGRRAEDAPRHRPAASGSSRSTASTATSPATPGWPARWACRTTTSCCARTATSSS